MSCHSLHGPSVNPAGQPLVSNWPAPSAGIEWSGEKADVGNLGAVK